MKKYLLVSFLLFLIHTGLAFATETDDRIESAAKSSYVFKQYLKDDSINVNSKDGVVTLSGSVSDANHRSLAQDTVAGLPGVTHVENNIEVKADSAVTENSDPWLALKVKTALLFHRDVSGLATHVDVKDGVVTLSGEVRDAAQKDLTAKYVEDIDGVKSVTNNLTVVSASDRATDSDEKMRVPKDGMVDARDKTADAVNGDDHQVIDDASITAQAKMTLLFHRSTSALSTKVTTENGVVTLTGNAKSEGEKELAGKLVGDIRGVINVVNNMTVAGP